MAAINSGISTKAFTYSFSTDGALGSGVRKYTGVTLAPGESILDLRYRSITPIVGGVNFIVQYGTSLGFSAQVMNESTAAINGSVATLSSCAVTSPGTNMAFKESNNINYPFNFNTPLGLFMYSTSPITSGKFVVLLTIAYIKA